MPPTTPILWERAAKAKSGTLQWATKTQSPLLRRLSPSIRQPVDALAVSIGTVHGFYKAKPKIEVERCAEIAEALPGVPLVLHGGTGTPPEDLQKVIKNGISKINIATEFMDTFLKSTRRELDKLDGKFLPIDKFMDPIIDDCAAHAARLLKFFAGK